MIKLMVGTVLALGVVMGTAGEAQCGSGECQKCIDKWCDFECDGIGDKCAPCIKRWCNFEC